MQFKNPATIQIKGLAIGVEVGQSAYASRVVDKCRKAGLLLATEDDALTMFPALTIDQQVARQGLDRLEECL